MELTEGDPRSIGGYRLEGRLGSGGMGVVYHARSESGRIMAVKVVHQQFADEPEFRARFRQEVDAACRVSGAFTAPVVDADPDAPRPWMATAYVCGPTLAQRLTDDGPLGGTELRKLAIGLAEALRDIHRVGVVHRDLKPSNVVLSEEGPRVIDFGISRAADNQHLTTTGRVMGTPPFMSPEQFRTPKNVGPETDVFSLATVLVYAACGHSPFEAENPYMNAYHVVYDPPELGGLPDVLRGIVTECLDKTPSQRPSAARLLEHLRELPAARFPAPGGARPPDPSTDQAHRSRRSLFTAGSIAAVAGTAIAVLAFGLPHGPHDNPRGKPSQASSSRQSSPPAGSNAWRKMRTQVLPEAVEASRTNPGHGPVQAFDGRRNTTWNPGVSGAGRGHWVEARFSKPVRMQDLIITPGQTTQGGDSWTSARRTDSPSRSPQPRARRSSGN